jgi:hypothetical protein
MLRWGRWDVPGPDRYLWGGRRCMWIPRLTLATASAENGLRDPKRQQAVERIDQTRHPLTRDEFWTLRHGFPTSRLNRSGEASMG